MSSSTDSSASAAQILVEYDGVDDGSHNDKHSPQGLRQAHQ